MMITLGVLHSVCNVVPPLSFLESFLAVLMLFGIIAFGVSMATDNT